jgi:hypothetical protein
MKPRETVGTIDERMGVQPTRNLRTRTVPSPPTWSQNLNMSKNMDPPKSTTEVTYPQQTALDEQLEFFAVSLNIFMLVAFGRTYQMADCIFQC